MELCAQAEVLVTMLLVGVVDLARGASSPLIASSFRFEALLIVLARRSAPELVDESEKVPPGPGVARKKDDL